MWIAFSLVSILAIVLGYLLYRASRAVLMFDDVLQGIVPVLEEYGRDLERMASADIGGILIDHPEVSAFHARNMRALASIHGIFESVASMVPKRRPVPVLPRPDVE